MNKNDFKNPLIQSGAILLFVFLLISVVAGSGSQGVWGSIGALFSGLISGFVFIIALCFSIVFSIFVIVLLFIAAVSIYSVDKGKEMWTGFTNSVGTLFQNFTGSNKTIARLSTFSSKGSEQPSQQVQVLTDDFEDKLASLDAKLDSFDSQLVELAQSSANQAEEITQLKQQLSVMSDSASVDEKFADMTVAHQALENSFEEMGGKITAGVEAQQQLEKRLVDEIGSIQEELKSLHEKTSVPETISGILSYIDLPEDRDLVTEKAKEAISRGMTYSQIDEFFKSSLKPEVYEELASHPRLTKDFLRSIKKKF